MSTPSDDWAPSQDDPQAWADDPEGWAPAPAPEMWPEPPVEQGPVAPAPEPPLEFDPAMMAAAIEVVREDLEKVSGTVLEHGEALDGLLEALTATPGGPWLWSQLSSKARKALWLQLGEWVAWLEGRWLVNLTGDDYKLPGCWWKHSVAVELLTALMVAHNATYSTKARIASTTLVEWHLRCLVPTFELLKSLGTFKACIRDHAHTPSTPRAREHDAAAFEAFVEADTAELVDDVDEIPTGATA